MPRLVTGAASIGAALAILLAAWPTEARRAPRTPSYRLGADSVARYEQFAVAADHPDASAAGAAILAAGGNAADAAAATMLALGVANPASSGLGGGGFALYYRASDRSLTFLDFRERAPAAATPDMYEGREPPMPGRANAASQVGGLASGVPGEPAGVEALVRRFGRLDVARVTAPAIALAEEGVPISGPLARMANAFGDQMRRDRAMAGWFQATGMREGETLRRPALLRALRAFAQRGARGIYEGRVAAQLVREVRAAGGIFTAQDLRDYRVVDRTPLEANHFGLRWVTAPPPSAGGFTMLQSLAILERIPERWRSFAIGSGTARDPSRHAAVLHAMAESWKGPFLDRQRYFGDPDHVNLPLGEMMANARLDARAAAFHPGLAMPASDYDMPLRPDDDVAQSDNAGTSHFCVVDAEGNVAAVTTTVNLPFGARYTAGGLVMNDEMDDFAREVGVANAFGLVGGAPNLPGPGKRPVSTMSPTIVFGADGAPALCIGASGGSRIVTAVQQVAMNTLLLGMTPEEAIRAPRVHHQGVPAALRSEEFAELPAAVLEALQQRGHAHDPIHNVATVQLIRIEPLEGAETPDPVLGGRRQLTAAADPRKGGRPAGR